MTDKYNRPTYQDDIEKSVSVMKRGGIILYPTDTVWGIGCDATCPEAVARIYELKKRADTKSMLVLVDNISALERLVREVPSVAYDMVELAIRPITIIYDDACGVAPNLIAEDGSLGIRVTKEAFSASLCKALRRPIVSTSANISGEPTPAIFSAVSPEIVNGVDYVVQYRQTDRSVSPSSQIIKLSPDGRVKVIRP